MYADHCFGKVAFVCSCSSLSPILPCKALIQNEKNFIAILVGFSNVYVDKLSRRFIDYGAFAATAKFSPEFEKKKTCSC